MTNFSFCLKNTRKIMSEDKVPKSNVGKPIYVESLMTPEEWKENNRKYPNTCKNSYPVYFKSEFDWRYRMGSGYSRDEIKKLNDNLEELRKFLKKQQDEEKSLELIS